MMVDKSFGEVTRPDVVVFPGGIGTRVLLNDEEVLDWLRDAHDHTTFTTSVCTGALVLAAAGLLTGLTATTHWRAQELFNSLGAQYVPQRVVEHLPQRIITAAGVSSGIDMALRLVELLVGRDAAEASQLMIEYDPEPPFDAGDLAKASDGHPGAGRRVLPAPLLTPSRRRVAFCLPEQCESASHSRRKGRRDFAAQPVFL